MGQIRRGSIPAPRFANVNWQNVLPDYIPTPLLILSADSIRAADPVVVSWVDGRPTGSNLRLPSRRTAGTL